MDYGKKALLRGLLGIPLGIAIGATIGLVINIVLQDSPTPEYYRSLQFFINSYISSAVIGGAYAGSSVIWEIEHWGFLKRGLIHFIIAMGVLLSCAAFAGWVELTLVDMLEYAGIGVGIYIVIFIVMCLIYRENLRKINAKIGNKKE